MQLLQIDFTPAIVVLGIGFALAVGFRWMEARAERLAFERTTEMLRELDETLNSRRE